MTSPHNAPITALLLLSVLSLADCFSVKYVLLKGFNAADMDHTPTQSLEDLTCWTCPDKTSNEACNKWAPDRLCPLDHSICKSTHRINIVTMETEVVTKGCALPEECTTTHVGCHDSDSNVDIKDCVSCCTGDYCNEGVPDDPLSALVLSFLPTAPSTASVPLTSELYTACVAIATRVLL